MSPDLAFNTSVSFETNTNWQNYSGETGATYLTQAAVLAVRNFTSAATGLAVAIALIRGLTRHSTKTLGNYWVDLTRGVLYILLPISIIGALVLVWQGVPQTWNPSQTVTTLQGAQQTIAIGPIASQEWIKELGNNGGGFFNANSAHPFESPTGLTNWLEIFALLICSFSLTYTFGRYAGNQRQGWTIFGAMAAILLVGAVVTMHVEASGNPLYPAGVNQAALGNMEGKETRFGAAVGGLFMAATTGTSTGAINSWHDSAQPIAGLVPLFNMELGEVTPGGIGAGMYGMLVIGAILAVFIAGLMVGRTPEFLGQEGRGLRDQDGDAHRARAGRQHPGLHRPRKRPAGGHGRSAQQGPARIQRDPLRLLEPDGQQRLGLRRPDRQHALLQHHRRIRDADRAVRDDRADPRPGRLDGRQAPRRAVPRHVPDDRRPVERAADRRRDHRRGADLLPGAVTRPDRRAAPAERRKGPVGMSLPRSLLSVDLGRGTRRFQRFVTLGGAKPSGEAPRPRGVFDPDLLKAALPHAFRKLDPRLLIKNPVMFVVEITAALVTLIAVANVTGLQPVRGAAGLGFQVQIAVWLWFTALFATYAEAVAEARGRAQAATLRRTRSESIAHRRLADGSLENVGSSELRKGDIIVVEASETIPSDGDVIEGIGFVNEAAITGESAPVLKEPGTDIRSSVTGGTTLTSDRLVIRVTADPGETFLDRMIALVEGAKRQRTPNEIALAILLAGLTIIFLMATVTLRPFGTFAGATFDTVALVALLVCLIPTTIGGLLSAIGIAGMDRVARFNVLAMSGRAVEASGDVDVILLDKTGTITYGNRLAASILAAPGVGEADAVEAALIASIRDETPEGRSIVELARKRLAELGRPGGTDDEAGFNALADRIVEEIPFRAETRTSGVRTTTGELILKGAVDAIAADIDGGLPPEMIEATDRIADQGATPLAIRSDGRVLGMIELKDTIKEGLVERFAEFRKMGIRTVMITGDNPRTAATIAREAGVDDFIAQATPEDKIAFIRAQQAEGHLVAMTGDGTNDAPAVAQADVGMAMNSGTSACKEAANMVDLDSDPTKLLEVIAIGKQLLITRGSITTFSIANDVAKYFAILPAMFVAVYPELNALNIMRLSTPQSAILSAVIFNALIIIALIPLALRGVAFRPLPASKLLQRNLLIYGLGGIIAPFIGIKAIDLLVSALHLA